MTVTRVMCVGIGGTGRDVLERIRRIIVDEFGSLDRLPIVSFVHIDTDSSGHIPKYRGQSIDFTPAERVHIAVAHHVVNQFKEHYEQRKENPYLSTPDDPILEWFPGELVRNLSAIENGAGAVRAVGRFALFKNYQAVRDALLTAYGRVAGADVAGLIQRGIGVQPGLRVFVTGSLCGGTGSGIFLDVGYILRHLLAQVVSPFESHAYFVVSPELYGNHEVVKANCYAALKELDYFNRPGTVFQAQYPGEPPLAESRLPYDFVYLISNSTPDARFVVPPTDPDAKGKIAYTIAQKICLFFTSSATAREVVSARDNLRQTIQNEDRDRHPRPNCQAYLTMGLASIYFPQDKINQRAVNQVKSQVLAFWQEGLGQAPTVRDIRQAYANQFDWGTEELGPFLRQRLQRIRVQGETIPALLERWRSLQEGQIGAATSRPQQEDLKAELPQRFSELLRFVQVGDTSRERGTWLAALVEQTADVTKDIKGSIEVFLEQILRPEHQFFGLENALNWCYSLKVDLERIRVEPLAHRPQDTDRQREEITAQMQQEIQAIRSRFWPWGKTPQIQAAFRKAVDQIVQLARRNYQWQVERQVRAAAEDLLSFLDKCIADLVAFKEELTEQAGRLRQEARLLAESNVQERIGLAIVSPQDVEDVVRTLLPGKEAERRQQLNHISTEIIRQLVPLDAETPPSLQQVVRLQAASSEIREALDRIVETKASQMTLQLRKSAIQRFIELGDTDRLLEHLQNLKHQSDILLPLNLNDGYFNNSGNKRVSLIAYYRPAEEDAYVRRFQELLERAGLLTYAQIKELPESEQHHVIFMTEYAAFPLRLINDLSARGMQFAYQTRSEHLGSNFLHTNKKLTFTDILPPSHDVVQRVEQLFFKCLGLDVFELEGDNLVAVVPNRFDPDKMERISLGNDWVAVIDQLSWIEISRSEQGGQRLTDVLQAQLGQRIAALVNNPDAWFGEQGQRQRVIRKIEQIRRYPEDHINAAMVDIVAGRPLERMTDVAKRGILEQLIEEIDNRIREQRKLATETALPGQATVDTLHQLPESENPTSS